MCLAPRYISGMTALPSRPWRNTASLPDTPCADAISGARTSAAASAAHAAILKRYVIAPPSRPLRSLPLILGVAVVAARVHPLAGGEDPVGALRFGGLQRDRSGVDERLRHLDPVATVDDALTRHQE